MESGTYIKVTVMDQIFDNFDVLPGYASGFVYEWAVTQSLTGEGPWSYWVQRSETHSGPWEDISPRLDDTYSWEDTGKFVAPKDPVLYFRVRAEIDGKSYHSHVRQPYGNLSRREFLLVKNMQRHELLQMQGMTGVCGKIYVKSIFGPKCTNCTDFVGGNPLDSDCPDCFGTGRKPGYHGPYTTWMTFSEAKRNKHLDNNKKGVQEPYTFTVRMLGTPRVKKDDILVDMSMDKRYYVDTIVNISEMRRIPIVQQVSANEIPVSSPLYRLTVESN